ncbi:LLM class flavin-dependent oxidoreductase [Homoserinibacter sp. GY 40078]|uniref:LLM class flavin-dependent oxidoreductase n=1 Tax=Homoserinibacter sp. GY 40078 TaxID=2603275 RepID=UPI0011C7C1A7|nr:LLM class flavin-dependent oxidoreductase [Homoserinibacter sp. GY 40078]TXK19845.1 LLM class flavin-dependent oxidoreductase [Homoserinibacter sp. GY 40078]
MSVPVSLGLQTDKAPGRYAELARLAEGLGFDGVSVFSDLFYQPAIVALLEMADATERIRLGCACWNPFLIHPVEIAGMQAALDARSGGRAYLGLARGSWLESVGVRPERPLPALREAIGVIRALWDGDRSGVEGRTFRLDPGVGFAAPQEHGPLELLVGSWGPRGAALAGELADEIKLGGCANPAMIEVTRERMAAGLELAGRPADDVGVVLGAVTVIDRDRDVARAYARRQVAMYVDVVAELDPTVELPKGMLDHVRAELRAGDADAAGKWIPDDVLELFAFSGDPDDIAAHAARLIEAGVDRIEFGTPHGIDEIAGIELLGRAVLPELPERST